MSEAWWRAFWTYILLVVFYGCQLAFGARCSPVFSNPEEEWRRVPSGDVGALFRDLRPTT